MMRRWWNRRSLLVRLTVWYAAAVGGMTLTLGLVVYGVVEHRLHSIFDRDLDADIDFIEARLEPDGKRLLPAHSREVRGSGGVVRPTAWFEVWTGNSELLLRQWPRRRESMDAFLSPPTPGPLRSYTAMPPDGLPVRVLERQGQTSHADFLFRAYRDETALALTLRQLLIGHLLASPFAALLSAFGGYLLARRSLAPVGAMAEQARRITSESLSRRLPVPNPHDELGQLAGVFNDTLQRLEDSFSALRRFTADASHELRTPLAALHAVGEVSLREPADAAGLRETVESMLEEAAKLDDIVEALLTLARAETTSNPVSREAIAIEPLLREVHASLGVLAAERRQHVQVTGRGDGRVQANRPLLRQVVMNLLHNAIRHGSVGGTIEMSWRGSSGRMVIEVTDDGPGIGPEDQKRIFERFYRADGARSGDGRGVGLGLAITRVFVEQQGGTIQVESAVGQGSRFRISLPTANGSH